jgi:hypothetical protein
MSLVRLSDTELTAVFEAARTLARCDRDKFLQELARALDAEPTMGPAVIHRVANEVQRRLFPTTD